MFLPLCQVIGRDVAARNLRDSIIIRGLRDSHRIWRYAELYVSALASIPTSGLSPRHYRPFGDYDPLNDQPISWDFGLQGAEDSVLVLHRDDFLRVTEKEECISHARKSRLHRISSKIWYKVSFFQTNPSKSDWPVHVLGRTFDSIRGPVRFQGPMSI